jgi:Flp pilus assembly protein TadD
LPTQEEGLVAELQGWLQAAKEEQRRGNMAGAAAKYREIVAARPEQWDAAYLLGTTLLQLGRYGEAVDVFQRLQQVQPNLPDVRNNLGVACQALNDFDRAASAYQAAITLQGDFDRAHLNLGRLREQQGLFQEAESCYRRVAELKPAERANWLRLAGALGKQNKWEEAEVVLRQAVNADRMDVDLGVNLAYALIQREQLDEAAKVYQHILARRPDYHEVHANLAFVRERQGRLEEAQAAALRAIELRPDYAEAFNNLGMILRSMHRPKEACRALRKALELKPDFALAEFNLGTTLLLAEDYTAGWRGYRLRARLDETETFDAPFPEWDGGPLPDKRLLVYSDQGFGDTIQFARFLARCKSQSQARVVLCCQPSLVALIAGLAGVDEIIEKGTSIPKCDAQIALASLPGLFGITVDSVGGGIPYLRPTRDLRPEIAELLRRGPINSLRVGLVWQGNPNQKRDVVRSCPLEKLMPLFNAAGATFFSLQTGEPGRRQIAELQLGERLIDVGEALTDFRETAAAMATLDLVITVDTATAHLAGALGRPVWTVLCHTPDWRWHLNRRDSPWYPTMRLFRQPRWGDWDSVVREIQDCLTARLTPEKKRDL